MPEDAQPKAATADAAHGASPDQIALEMMKFIAVTTGYGRGSGPATGFGAEKQSRSPEQYADALLDLFEKCRTVVKKA